MGTVGRDRQVESGESWQGHINPFYPDYDSSRSYPFYPEYDSSRSLHLTRLPCTLTFWNPFGWLTLNDVSKSGSLGNPYFSTNQCRSLGICSIKRGTPKLKWNQRWRRVAKTVKCWHILKDNAANLLHTGDDKKADKWIDDIRWMVFDVTFVHEDILWNHRNGVNRQRHPFSPTSPYFWRQLFPTTVTTS